MLGEKLSGHGKEQSQHANAGRKSGAVRLASADIRRLIIKAAFNRLAKKYHMQPYSDDAIDALQEECTKMPDPDDEDWYRLFRLAMDGHKITIHVPRDTLIDDMKKKLGIRSKLRKRRSG
jgi:hypothetical protein